MKKAIIILSILFGCLFSLSAQEGVSINEDGSAADGSAILDVQSATKGVLLPRVNLTSTSSSSPISGTPAVGLLVFNLATANDVVPGFYFWNGTAWQAVSSASSGSAPLAIGDNAHGGIVFYIFQSGDPGYVSGEEHGLVCALTDQSAGAPWGCNASLISGADGTAIGTGNQNTIDIEAGCTTAGTAADICANLVLNGYSDWFLPSKDESIQMYLNLHLQGLGGFATSSEYWTSTEFDAGAAYTLFTSTGATLILGKTGTPPVRAVRAF